MIVWVLKNHHFKLKVFQLNKRCWRMREVPFPGNRSVNVKNGKLELPCRRREPDKPDTDSRNEKSFRVTIRSNYFVPIGKFSLPKTCQTTFGENSLLGRQPRFAGIKLPRFFKSKQKFSLIAVFRFLSKEPRNVVLVQNKIFFERWKQGSHAHTLLLLAWTARNTKEGGEKYVFQITYATAYSASKDGQQQTQEYFSLTSSEFCFRDGWTVEVRTSRLPTFRQRQPWHPSSHFRSKHSQRLKCRKRLTRSKRSRRCRLSSDKISVPKWREPSYWEADRPLPYRSFHYHGPACYSETLEWNC